MHAAYKQTVAYTFRTYSDSDHDILAIISV